MQGQKFTINSEYTLKCWIAHITEEFHKHKYLEAQHTRQKTRTQVQNNALHVYCRDLGLAFNEAGYDMKLVLSHHAEIPWDDRGYNVKERIWRPVQISLTQEESTTKPKTIDYPKIYEAINRHTAERLGISIDWPVRQNSQ